jgi:hypothetical protein
MGVLASAPASRGADAAPPVVVDEPIAVEAPVTVDVPAFPGVVPRQPVRLSAGVFVAPEASFDGGDIGLVRPEIRGRATMPFAAVASIQLTADFRASLYDVEGRQRLFADCADCPDPDDLYSSALGMQGGYGLNEERHLFHPGEQWAVLGAIFVRARWEPGAFLDGVTPGCSIGLGYRLEDRLRLALGVRIARDLDGGGVDVDPGAYLRWNIVPKVQLRNRGLGAQLEYRPTERVELFLSGFRDSDSFRLDDRPGLASGTTFRDRQVLVGGGVVLTLSDKLKLAVELGAIVDRRMSLNAPSGRVASRDVDPSPYFALRGEARL